jgi:predicted metal-dependent phosphoesterase TrpH
MPHSDDRLTPRERVMEAWKHGYDAIAITDHGNHKSHVEAVPLARSLGLILIRGMETGVAKAEHYVAVGIPTTGPRPRAPNSQRHSTFSGRTSGSTRGRTC